MRWNRVIVRVVRGSVVNLRISARKVAMNVARRRNSGRVSRSRRLIGWILITRDLLFRLCLARWNLMRLIVIRRIRLRIGTRNLI